MLNQSVNTEQAQYALNMIIDAMQSVYAPLVDKKNELQELPSTDEIRTALAVINIRMDTLLKLEKFLISAVRDEYACIEKHAVKPGELAKIIEARNKSFIEAMLQGL